MKLITLFSFILVVCVIEFFDGWCFAVNFVVDAVVCLLEF